MIERKHIKKIIMYFLSIATFFAVWAILAKVINAPLIMPPIRQVLRQIVNLGLNHSFWINFLHTLARVLLAFVISLVLGFTLGLLSGLSQSFKAFLDFPLTFVRSTPVVAIILLTLFWFNSSSVPVFVAVLMCLPIVVTAVTEGMEQNNNNLMFMADVYKLSKIQKIKYIKLYDLIPFFLNASVSVFGLSWKVVVAGEVLSIPKYGFGTLMETAQVHLETATVIAITIILVLASFILEKLLKLIVSLVKKSMEAGI